MPKYQNLIPEHAMWLMRAQTLGFKVASEDQFANVSFNITNGKAITLEELAGKIIEITNSESDIEDIGSHPLYPMRGTLDIGRAKDLLGYEPEISLEEGLKSYYEWLKN